MAEPNRLTVNALMRELRKVQRAGRGSNPVFLSMAEYGYVLATHTVKGYHNARDGHIVIASKDKPSTWRD